VTDAANCRKASTDLGKVEESEGKEEAEKTKIYINQIG
jgi:hypothetical protein